MWFSTFKVEKIGMSRSQHGWIVGTFRVIHNNCDLLHIPTNQVNCLFNIPIIRPWVLQKSGI